MENELSSEEVKFVNMEQALIESFRREQTKKELTYEVYSTMIAQWEYVQVISLSYMYRIAGIFRGAKFSRRPLWLYYSNYLRVEFRAAVVPRKINPFTKTKD